jgi:hypothetical protein
MSENTHPAVAKFRQEGVHEWQSQEGETDATVLAAILDAQVEATLALAYEQRTANLLAYLKYSEGDDYEAVHSAIKERLDLS